MRVRLPGRSVPGRWRRRLPAAALVWSVVVALGVAPIGLGAVAPAAAASGSARTVVGPHIWIPETQSKGPEGSITVAQTKNLTNQVVQVSWTGFTPTVDSMGAPVTVTPPLGGEARYPVRVYQCRGAKPDITDCYGSTLFNTDPAKGFEQPKPAPGVTTPDFPSNMVVAPTGPDGSGVANIEVWTSGQSPTLGCDATHPCSLVVEPNYGGDSIAIWNRKGKTNCDNHDADVFADGFTPTATDKVMGQGNVRNQLTTGEMCAWANHIAIPLEFAPTPDACQERVADLTVAGLEMANRAMQQWRTGLCLGSTPLSVQYSPSGGEPQAREDFLGGRKDVALTARPDGQAPPRPYVYAPLATSGISVVFAVDDPVSGRQIRDMKLNARLLAKMLTQSYLPTGSDIASVRGNPVCVFADPEFVKLNPLPPASGLAWPTFCDTGNSSPTVVGGTTDLVHQLTSWIASDPDAVRFLDGEPDPWGMHVDSFYLRPTFSGYPVESFIRQDSSGVVGADKDPYDRWKQYEWNPNTMGLGDMARKLLQNTPNCVVPTLTGDGTHVACPAMLPGQRTLFTVMDSGQAKAFSLPEAQLLNPAGQFVSPDGAGFQAAVADMPTDPATGVQQLPYGTPDTAFSRDQRAYPLTTVQYAMVPTQGLSAAKAEAVATFVKTVTTSGQVYGFEPGKLAAGFLALNNAQRRQAEDAAGHVAAQDGKLPGNQVATPPPAEGGEGGTPASGSGSSDGSGGSGLTGSGTPGGSADGSGLTGSSSGGPADGSGGTGGTGTAAQAAAAGAKPGATPGASGSPLAAAAVAAGTPAADRSGAARLLLPVALVGGLVLLVGGPAALILGGTPAGDRVLNGLRNCWSRVRRRF
ncbi:hypothetical protein [Kitasatospora brasiliensis]|uniref:hypothetical protein n=1 Tax=Kitasatospora brasiliensis TaxID=3058040 RepID=UPI00292D107B|nr:hypothetical protein [Kitasatospora sp. K002]